MRFVITDKQRDLWYGDVYYDLEQSATVAPGESLDLDLSGYPSDPVNSPNDVFNLTSNADTHALDRFAPGQTNYVICRSGARSRKGHRYRLGGGAEGGKAENPRLSRNIGHSSAKEAAP